MPNMSPFINEKQCVFKRTAFVVHECVLLSINPISTGHSLRIPHDNKIVEIAEAIPTILNYVDDNDTVSKGFIGFHSKNETIKREVKLSFRTETMLISLSIGIYSVSNLSVSSMSFSIRGRILSLYFDKSAP